MFFLIGVLPIILFILIFVGSGIFFAINNVEMAFYKIAPTVAILPSLILAWLTHSGDSNKKTADFVSGAGHSDIITMCFLFLLSGAFSAVTKDIGSVDNVVNLAVNAIPSANFLLIIIFLTSAFIATAIGTSMGTIAALTPIAVGLVEKQNLPLSLTVGTIVSGAMFGDNLSFISDTTIASVSSQGADLFKKTKINIRVATIASLITIFLLFFSHSSAQINSHGSAPISVALILPYLALITMALLRINVFVVLTTSLLLSFIIGIFWSHQSLLGIAGSVTSGFLSMHEIIVLSLLIGGLSGLTKEKLQLMTNKLIESLPTTRGPVFAQLLIAKIVSIFDLLLANNTIAIILSGGIVKDLSLKYKIPAHYSAAWIDIFSCVWQGVIPYGAQILLASSIAKTSPLSIVFNVYYSWILGLVSICYIILNKKLKE